MKIAFFISLFWVCEVTKKKAFKNFIWNMFYYKIQEKKFGENLQNMPQDTSSLNYLTQI